ncbi:hypothetical protein [Metallibacterium scheffleri]
MGTLNAQLLFRPSPHEHFVFGKNPPPLPERLAPRYFERAYVQGNSPDGDYASEIYDAKEKFNLYDRVTERVPESRYWLLREIQHFLTADPPSIDVSVRVIRTLLADLNLVFLERDAVEAWSRFDDESLSQAERDSLDALTETPLPGHLSLVFALSHLAAWMEPPRDPLEGLTGLLQSSTMDAATLFIKMLRTQGFEDLDDIIPPLSKAFLDATESIDTLGPRSVTDAAATLPPDFVHHLVLVPDTPANRSAIVCLASAREDPRFESPRPGWAGGESASRLFDCTAQTAAHGSDPQQAVSSLLSASAEVPQLLRTRALRILGGYKGMLRGTYPVFTDSWIEGGPERRAQNGNESLRTFPAIVA